MEIVKQFLTENLCYKAGKAFTPRGIMVHSTGANNPYLSRYVQGNAEIGYNTGGNHWNTPTPDGRKVCVHAFVGKKKNGGLAVVQTLPWNMRGWHCGGDGNNTYIGFEICEDALTDKSYFEAAYNTAVELCVILCKQYGLSAKDVIDHSEGYQKGIASNHGDVKHWFSRFGRTMNDFRADVSRGLIIGDAEMKSEKRYNNINEIPDWAKNTILRLIEKNAFADVNKLDLSLDMLRLLVIIERAVP